MHCASCEILISKNLQKVAGITGVKANHQRGEAIIYFSDSNKPSAKAVRGAVQDAGYNVGAKDKLPWFSDNPRDYKDLAKAAVILFGIYLIGRWLNIFDLNVTAGNTGVMVALLVGLVAGVSTCMALIGGLVLGLSARHAELHPEATPMQKFRPHIYFNVGRVLGYAGFGGLIGLIGQAFKPSNNLLGFLTIVIGAVMLFFGLKLIEIFPVLKDKSITLPSGIAKIFGLHKEVKEYSHKSALVMGGLTFFLPCGFTQAMQLYAVSTGSFWQGMAIMGLFALGTAPGLLGIGGLTSVFKGHKAKIFFMTAGLAVIILGWTNIANGSRLFSGVKRNSGTQITKEVQEVRMTQHGRGYSPNVLTVQKGKTVKWVINSTDPYTCASALIMPKFGINELLRKGENVILFTPTEVGEVPFSCSMGMYRGKFIVTDNSDASTSATSVSTVAPSTPVSCGSRGGGCGGCGGSSRTPVAEQVGQVQNKSNEQVINTSYTLNNDISPNSFTVKKGVPVKFVVDVKENGQGCMSTIMIPGLYNVPEYLEAGKKIEMSFTPTEAGDFSITCAMGVPRGNIKVVD